MESWKIRRPKHGARRGGITQTTCSCCAQSRLPRLNLGAKDIKTGSEEALYLQVLQDILTATIPQDLHIRDQKGATKSKILLRMLLFH